MDATTILYRPVGHAELQPITESGFKAFPPRLPGQPIFYPLLNEELAIQIARDGNAKDPKSGVGYVTRFRVRTVHLSEYTMQSVGGSIHKEYWIPADEVATFNENIVGTIEVIAKFHGS